ncbi:DEAD/DEAH box helicase [Peribacillus psychrosaccharolyticus]|uniref:DEAD/DEAH box helicase n=1 Tax=Peribacillus psychrosaccharolyticus TaxID=1407 RepID=A0A974S0H5_PERPY|nr:DEAD/DEAH box helicase [Peribacillus psychrosaccharolyticus]MEC2056296.1 DEAD/DEAH box helicase [Peribacillus psychrosaccharolyticus]MED3743698.1 DEAD/DEAH box helicase [Peribacillus psychrosaccharolyticus]QQT00534.1 DEAD/DEAH box helicase [Peribacillus psychrosaccharolyticus]
MSFHLTKTSIKEMCGVTAYRRGESYLKAEQVVIDHYDSSVCEAAVKGDFHVILKSDESQDVYAHCSCPTLGSFTKYCQHIAAVMLYVQQHHRSLESTITQTTDEETISQVDLQLTNEILGLFTKKQLKLKTIETPFDSRQPLDVELIFKPYPIDDGKYLFGVEIKAGLKRKLIVQNLREFLEKIERKERFFFSPAFSYDPEEHFIPKEIGIILQQLILIHHNEQDYLDRRFSIDVTGKRLLLVPPASWENMLPLLTGSPFAKIEHNGHTIEEIFPVFEKTGLYFEFDESPSSGFQLSVLGLTNITVMEAYGYVLSENKILKLSAEDCLTVGGLKQTLDRTGKHQFQIHESQMEHYLAKVIPGLRKLGTVHISEAVTGQLVKKSLKAKLYLDRVNNNLLAGLEFHYGQLVINPLEEENHERKSGSILIRDNETEAKILQIMDDSSFAKTEGGYFMHNEELEYHFLYHVVPQMKDLVELYASTSVKARIHRSSPRPRIRVDADNRTDWLVFRFDLEGIPESEIRNLLVSLEAKHKFYRLPNGSLMTLESTELAEIKRLMKELDLAEEDLAKEFRLPLVRGFQLLDSLEDNQSVSIGDSFRELVETMKNPSQLTFDLPKSLEPILRGYQKQGFQWLKTLAHYRFGGILADDMGLGKTLQSIAYMVSVLLELRKHKLPILVVTPSSLTYNWLNELTKFAPEIEAVIVDGDQAERRQLLREATEVDVIITSYPLLRSDLAEYSRRTFHSLFLDEAQTFKNPTTQTAKAVKKLKADYIFALTGTPVENSLEELWSLFDVVFPNYLPNLEDFLHLPRKKIAKRIRPFILRRLKTDVLNELPEKIETIQTVGLLPDQKKLYAAYLAKLKQETLKHLDKDNFGQNKIRILAGLTRLRQLCCHPALFVEGYQGSSSKFEQLLEIIDECQRLGRRVLIFSQFTKMLDIIGRSLGRQDIPYFYLDGQTPAAERVELCARFNDGEQDIFLISLKAGGTGLNLTGADTVILYDLWWNPAVEQQAADRAHRMGQKNVVQVIKLVAHGTIEEKIYELQERKKNMIDEIIQPGKEPASTLTEQDIREILSIK